VGEGTSFYLYFPITRETVETDKDDEIVGGNESILIVDDDEAQCTVALRLLKKLGYRATAVNSGMEAVEYIKNNPQDLILLDMIMPDGIDGTETYQQILEFYPNQKAIIVSGYAESSRVEKARQLGIDMYIRKPLTLKLIASCIRKMLDKKEVTAEIL
jgi:CheY-like chemotaxis protein